MPPAVLATDLAPLWTDEPGLTPIARVQANGPRELMAQGFERREQLPAMVAGAPLSWPERRLGIRSHHLTPAGERALQARLANAQAAIAALPDRRRGKRRVTALPALQEEVAAIVARYHVPGLLQVQYEAQTRQRPVRR